MDTQIKFTRKMNFTGRNGYFAATGLDVTALAFDNKVMIAPLTGKGNIARCDITIPKEDIPLLIKKLEECL